MSLIAAREQAPDNRDAERAPTWSATALLAEPTPESPCSTDPTTEFVAVGNKSPAPRPMSIRPATTSP